MSYIRIEENVPEIYVNESRDFQLLCRLFNLIVNDLLYSSSTMRSVSDTENSPSELLDLLCGRVGFHPLTHIPGKELRAILKCFPHLIKYKGSKICIAEAVIMFLKIKHQRGGVVVHIINKEQAENNTTQNTYKIIISTEHNLGDVTILNELWRYLIPTGYDVEYARLSKVELTNFNALYHNTVTYADMTKTTNETTGSVRSNADPYTTNTIENRTIGGADTFVIYSPGDEE